MRQPLLSDFAGSSCRGLGDGKRFHSGYNSQDSSGLNLGVSTLWPEQTEAVWKQAAAAGAGLRNDLPTTSAPAPAPASAYRLWHVKLKVLGLHSPKIS